MTLIVAGLFLWGLAHAFKRLAPGLRDRLGDRARGGVAILILTGLVLMVVGYRTAQSIYVWSPPQVLVIANNLLMLVAVYMFTAAGAKSRLARSVRHPMLNGLIVWGTAHLLANGNGEDLVLFGGLIFWAFLERALIDRVEPWVIPDPVPVVRELRVLIVTAVIYVGIVYFHGWVGPDPFWDGWPTDRILPAIIGGS